MDMAAISKRNKPNKHVSTSVLVIIIILIVLPASSASDSSTNSPHNATPSPGYLGHKQPVYGGRKVVVERMLKIDITDDYPPARVKPAMPTPCC
ncbi:unnamed protein product [Linum trigynum]|uniref:Transmembrane protein n=1 Tax=Linum trigynum TaxID=586398 RepID=A0AAV2GQG2_9ROSI